MTHYLPAVGLLAAVAVVVFVGTLLIREDATTTDGTAAPERNERRAIATAEDPTTTDGTAAPERNEGTRLAADEPTTTDDTAAPGSDERGAISAAEFLGGQRSELARYQEVREDLVRVTGRLREVSLLKQVWVGGIAPGRSVPSQEPPRSRPPLRSGDRARQASTPTRYG